MIRQRFVEPVDDARPECCRGGLGIVVRLFGYGESFNVAAWRSAWGDACAHDRAKWLDHLAYLLDLASVDYEVRTLRPAFEAIADTLPVAQRAPLQARFDELASADRVVHRLPPRS